MEEHSLGLQNAAMALSQCYRPLQYQVLLRFVAQLSIFGCQNAQRKE
jgi:hypothetical protein